MSIKLEVLSKITRDLDSFGMRKGNGYIELAGPRNILSLGRFHLIT